MNLKLEFREKNADYIRKKNDLYDLGEKVSIKSEKKSNVFN